MIDSDEPFDVTTPWNTDYDVLIDIESSVRANNSDQSDKDDQSEILSTTIPSVSQVPEECQAQKQQPNIICRRIKFSKIHDENYLKTIITWNVNSVRNRAEQIKQLLMSEQPTCLGLQETKCDNHMFPKELMNLGYHVVISGQKMNNGVAMFLKTEPIKTSTVLLQDEPQDCRYIEAEMNDNTVYINVYIPQGQKFGSEKYKNLVLKNMSTNSSS